MNPLPPSARDHLLERDHCPVCNRKLDAATEVAGDGDAGPRPGDLTICIGCAAILGFEHDLKLRRLGADDLARLDRETYTTLLRAVLAVQMARRAQRSAP